MATAMIRRKTSYRVLGFLTNRDPGYLWRVAKGERSPSRATAFEIARALNVPVSQLWKRSRDSA